MRTTVCEIFLNGWRSSTENLGDADVPAHAHISHDSDSERPAQVALRTHSIKSHFAKDRNCEVRLRTKVTRAPCRRRTGEAPLRAQKSGDLITADHNVLNEECESRNNHRYAFVVEDLATQWMQPYPCKTKTSQQTEKSLRKFIEPSQEPNVIWYRQFFGILQILWSLIMESSNFDTSSIRDKWHCWKSRKTSERRNFSSIATIRIGWTMVGWFFGMLLLFAKCPRPRGRWGGSLWKTVWRSVQRTKNAFWSNGRISPDFTTRSVRTSSTWQESSIWDLSWVWADRGLNLERRYSDCGFGRFGKVGRIRKSILEESMQKMYWRHKGEKFFLIPSTRW